MVKLFSKNSNLCDHNSPTLQTDRQTTCDRNTALCTKVHRAVNSSRLPAYTVTVLPARRTRAAENTFAFAYQMSRTREYMREVKRCNDSTYTSGQHMCYTAWAKNEDTMFAHMFTSAGSADRVFGTLLRDIICVTQSTECRR